MIIGLLGGLLLIVTGVVCVKVTEHAVDGRLPLNHLAGIRTADTLVSEDAWRAGHAAALPVMRGLNRWCWAFGAAMAVWGAFLPAESVPVPFMVFGGVAYLGFFIGGGRAAVQANRAAKAVQA